MYSLVELKPSEPFFCVGVYSDLYYQLFLYFGCRMYYGLGVSKFTVVDVTY